jgi:hypothetical protein
MGMKSDHWENEVRHRTWLDFCAMPGHRTAKAMRELLGLSPGHAAMHAGIPHWLVTDFESGDIDPLAWRPTSRRLNAAYQGLGAGWFEPDLHEGAFQVHLSGRTADNRQAINAALALLGCHARRPSKPVNAGVLAARVERRTRIPAKELRAALSGRTDLSERMATACFQELGERLGAAGCYFVPAGRGRWRLVGCGYEGAWW